MFFHPGFCRLPRPPENGIIFFGSPETSYLAMVTFGCQEGYHIDRPTNLTCGKNGQFLKPLPVDICECMAVFKYSDRVNYVCALQWEIFIYQI